MKTDEIIRHVGQTFEVVLENNGGSGFSIQWEMNNEDIAKVERLENISPTNQQAGSPIETKYCIRFMKKGEVNVHFYETRVWEDNFPKKTLKSFRFRVDNQTS